MITDFGEEQKGAGMNDGRFAGLAAALHTLGCKVNEYETDSMRAALEDAGFIIVDFHQRADVYVVNTCSVTNIADRKSRQMLSRAKRNNPDAVVVAVGCYVQTALERTGKVVDADILIGSSRKKSLVEELERYFERRDLFHGTASDIQGVSDSDGRSGILPQSERESGRVREQSGIESDRLMSQNVSDVMHEPEYEKLSLPRIENHTRAFVKVQDGCNLFCSYCIIPYARGRIRSRKMEEVLDEVETLAMQGIREVVLTGIHLSSYGVDFAGSISEAYGESGEKKTWQKRSKLIDLIEAVSGIGGIERIRLGSLEPTIITEDFVRRLKRVRKICPHFHLSLQSGCDSVLKRMNRHYTTQEYLSCLELLRGTFQDPAITTDVIVGFPGESDEEFGASESFLNEAGLYETHLFRYSMRAGTKAALMPDQIPERIKEDRLSRLSSLDRKMRKRFEDAWNGREVEVLFEEEAQIDENERILAPNSGKMIEDAKLPAFREKTEKLYTGYTREYIRVYAMSSEDLRGKVRTGHLDGRQIVLGIRSTKS